MTERLSIPTIYWPPLHKKRVMLLIPAMVQALLALPIDLFWRTHRTAKSDWNKFVTWALPVYETKENGQHG